MLRLLVAHPRQLDETYFEHQRTAFAVGATMVAAGFAALIHGLLPCFFQTTASRTVASLHLRMAARAAQAGAAFAEEAGPAAHRAGSG